MSEANSPGAGPQRAGGAGTTEDPDATAVLGGETFQKDPALERALEEARAKADEHFNQTVRVLAEFDNFRKRAARDLESAQRYAVERFVGELLPVVDGFELATQSAAGADANTLIAGQAATLRLLLKAFEKAGITTIDPTGLPFDPTRHEAIAAQPNPSQPPDTVLQTVQKGYLLNGRLLRPARVIVARAPDA
jgi:molecular chaperone GrpE